MKKKNFFMAAVFLIGILMFAACGKGTDKVGAKDDQKQDTDKKTYKFGLDCVSLSDPYYIEIRDTLKKSIEAGGSSLITKDAAYDAEKQERQIDEFIAEDIDLLFLAPVDSQAVGDSLDKLYEAGIRVVNIDAKAVSDDKTDAFVEPDNDMAGSLCGGDLLLRCPQGGSIIVVDCPSRSSVSERIKGFEKSIAKKGFEVVARVDASGSVDDALVKVSEAFAAHPGVVAIVCGDDQIAVGALAAVKSAGATGVLIYGAGGSPDVKKELAKGDSMIAATAALFPDSLARAAADTAFSIMRGEKYESETVIESVLITKDNLSEYPADTW